MIRRFIKWLRGCPSSSSLGKGLEGLQDEISSFEESSARAVDVFQKTITDLDAQNTRIKETMGTLTQHSISISRALDSLAVRKSKNERISSKIREFLDLDNPA